MEPERKRKMINDNGTYFSLLSGFVIIVLLQTHLKIVNSRDQPGTGIADMCRRRNASFNFSKRMAFLAPCGRSPLFIRQTRRDFPPQDLAFSPIQALGIKAISVMETQQILKRFTESGPIRVVHHTLQPGGQRFTGLAA